MNVLNRTIMKMLFVIITLALVFTQQLKLETIELCHVRIINLIFIVAYLNFFFDLIKVYL